MAMLDNQLPRSEDVVRLLVTERATRELHNRKIFLSLFVILAAIGIILLYVHGGAYAVVTVVFVAPAALFLLLVGLLVGRGWKKAEELVRNGVAYPARIQERDGGGRGSTLVYEIRWTDSAGREGLRRFAVQTSPPPKPGPDSVVLVKDGIGVVGVVVQDYLFVG